MSFIKVGNILDSLPLKEGMAVAEFGSGSGDFALELAKRIPEGRVYALDVQSGTLSALEGKAKSQGVYNIKTILCDLEENNGSTLQDSFLDMVLIPNVLFQSDNPADFMVEAFRVLKSGGYLMLLDWKKDGGGIGPAKSDRISVEEAKKIAEEQGFFFEKEIGAGLYHWALLFEKH